MFCGASEKKNCVRYGKEIRHRPSLLLGGAVNAGSLLRFSLSLCFSFQGKAVKTVIFLTYICNGGYMCISIFLFKFASQSLLPCVLMVLILYLSLYCFVSCDFEWWWWWLCDFLIMCARVSVKKFLVFFGVLSKLSHPLSICETVNNGKKDAERFVLALRWG